MKIDGKKLTFPSSDDSCLEDKLREILESIASMAQASNISLVAHRPEAFTYYKSLPNLRKQEILRACATYNQICMSTIEDGRPLSDTRALLWSSLKCYGLAPCSDLMDHVDDDLAVELYDIEGRQIFRNFKFMEVCSYTLADVLVYPWWELFRRNDDVMGQVLKEVEAVLSGTIISTLPSGTPSHQTGEIFSTLRHELEMKFRFFSPVFNRATKNTGGFVCASEVQVLYSTLSKVDESRPAFRIVSESENLNIS